MTATAGTVSAGPAPRTRAPLKVLGYTRVSTADQVEGYSLEDQDQAIRQFVAANHLNLVGIHTDAGRTAARYAAQSAQEAIGSRPGLVEVLRRLRNDEAQILVVTKLDRLSRDLIVQETIIQRLESQQIAVISTTEGEQTGGDHTRRLVRQILGVIADYERSMIRERMNAGKRIKRERGGYCGGGIPYGWHVVNGELAEDAAEQAVLRVIAELRASGLTQGRTADLLNERGFRNRKGGRWNQQTIQRIEKGEWRGPEAAPPSTSATAGTVSNGC